MTTLKYIALLFIGYTGTQLYMFIDSILVRFGG